MFTLLGEFSVSGNGLEAYKFVRRLIEDDSEC